MIFHYSWWDCVTELLFYHRASLCVSAVFAVARCPSVTFMYCIHTAEVVV